MKKIIITGGLGYLGGRIAEYLSSLRKYKIYITTRKDIYPEAKIELQDTVLAFNNLSDLNDLKLLFEDAFAVIHLAGSNEIESANSPVTAIDSTIKNTWNVLEASRIEGVQKVIYFSTIHVYGKNLNNTITEETIPRPAHPYAITHKAAEDFVLAYRDNFKMDNIVFRLSNAFGCPYHSEINRWSLLVNDLCKQAVNGNTLTLKSDGSQTRDFISISEVCRTVEYFLNLSIDKTKNGLFNLGGKCSLSVNEMAAIVADRSEQILGKKLSIYRKSNPNAEPKESGRINYSVTRLESTGISISSDYEKEINDTLLFCQNHFSTIKT